MPTLKKSECTSPEKGPDLTWSQNDDFQSWKDVSEGEICPLIIMLYFGCANINLI